MPYQSQNLRSAQYGVGKNKCSFEGLRNCSFQSDCNLFFSLLFSNVQGLASKCPSSRLCYCNLLVGMKMCGDCRNLRLGVRAKFPSLLVDKIVIINEDVGSLNKMLLKGP